MDYVGRYELLGEIASGGMAKVYLARVVGEGGFEREVAVKVMHEHLASDPEFVAMFLDEARLAARIRHPNVVPTLDVQKTDQVMYLVMEFVEGLSLATMLRQLRKKKQPLPPDIALRVLLDTLQGLHAAHELTDRDDKPLNLVHRDVSPANILVGTDGVARITDFGVARAEARLTSTRGGQVKGKLQYMPPEQIIADEVDRRADVYAAGVVMWELLVGRRLFDAQHEGAVLQQVLNGARTSPAQENPRVPKAIDQVCMRALSVDPSDRFTSAIAYAEEIEEASRAAGLRVASGQRVATFVRGFETNAAKIAEARKSLPGTLPTLDLGASASPQSRAAAAAAESPVSQASSVSDSAAQGAMIQSSAAQVLSTHSAAFMAPQLQQSRRGLVVGLGVGLVVGVAAVVVAVTKPWADPPPAPAAVPPPVATTAEVPEPTAAPEPPPTATATETETETATETATATATEEADTPPARPPVRRPPPPRPKTTATSTAKTPSTSGGSAADFLPPTL